MQSSSIGPVQKNSIPQVMPDLHRPSTSTPEKRLGEIAKTALEASSKIIYPPPIDVAKLQEAEFEEQEPANYWETAKKALEIAFLLFCVIGLIFCFTAIPFVETTAACIVLVAGGIIFTGLLVAYIVGPGRSFFEEFAKANAPEANPRIG